MHDARFVTSINTILMFGESLTQSCQVSRSDNIRLKSCNMCRQINNGYGKACGCCDSQLLDIIFQYNTESGTF